MSTKASERELSEAELEHIADLVFSKLLRRLAAAAAAEPPSAASPSAYTARNIARRDRALEPTAEDFAEVRAVMRRKKGKR